MTAGDEAGTLTLIDRLAGEVKPVSRRALLSRAALGTAGGLAIAAALILLYWGPRPDMVTAMAGLLYWIKFAFTGLLALSGFAAFARLSRPGATSGCPALAVSLVVAVMALLAAGQLTEAPAALRRSLVMGATASVCSWLIMLFSVPVFAGLIWAARAMAPTRLRLAGAAAGLTAGAGSAAVYALACDESALPFVLIWYGLAIAATTAIGALLGPRLLRW